METPHKTASGSITESPLVLVDAITGDVVVGHGMVFTYTAAALQPTADLIRNMEAAVKSEPLAPGEIERKLTRQFRLLGTLGLVAMAIASIETAPWDALARSHNSSLTRLLDGIEKPVQAYGPVGYEGPAGSARLAEVWVRRGFKGVKAKIGYPDVREELKLIRSIRAAAGDGVAIMADYNQSLTPAEAVERLRVLTDEGLTRVEEPTLAHDYRGHAWSPARPRRLSSLAKTGGVHRI